MKKYAAILFDLDGTLVNTIDLYSEAVIGSLQSVGVSITQPTFREWYMGAVHLKEILAKFKLTEQLVPNVRKERDERYIKLLREKAEWIPGAEDLLKKSLELGPVAIITGSWRTYVDAINERIRVSEYFDTIVTCDDMGNFMKPHPHGLLLAAEKLGVNPEECLYVGDQHFDVEAAHRAGMPCAVVRSGYTPQRAMDDADFKAESLAELTTMLS